MGDRRWVSLEGRGGGDELGGADEEKTIIMTYCLGKKFILNLKGVVLFVMALCI